MSEMKLSAQRLWFNIKLDGKVEFIDWDIAEDLADAAKKQTGFDAMIPNEVMNVIAFAIVGVREYVLRTEMPNLEKRKGKASDEQG